MFCKSKRGGKVFINRASLLDYNKKRKQWQNQPPENYLKNTVYAD